MREFGGSARLTSAQNGIGGKTERHSDRFTHICQKRRIWGTVGITFPKQHFRDKTGTCSLMRLPESTRNL